MISTVSDGSTTRVFKYKYEITHEGLSLCTASTGGKGTPETNGLGAPWWSSGMYSLTEWIRDWTVYTVHIRMETQGEPKLEQWLEAWMKTLKMLKFLRKAT